MFEWQIDEEPEEKQQVDGNGRNWGKWVLAILVLLLLATGWGATQNQIAQRQTDLQQQVQNNLDFTRNAYAQGDGELFFSTQSNDPAWVSAQLQPINQTVYANIPQVTQVEQNNNNFWANVRWQEGTDVYQKVMFFELRGGRLQQTATSPDYWGASNDYRTAFGQLTLYEIDKAWLADIATFTRQLVWELCPDACDGRDKALQIFVSDHYGDTAVPNRITIPSPRLVTLTDAGEPAQPFWDLLEMRIRDQFEPTTIRFGVPPFGMQYMDYAAAAEQFMAQNPNIRIELIPLPSQTLTATQLLTLDGAAITPDASLLASGAVFDLTDFVQTDPNFDQRDYYEQIWQGALWQDRVWFLPQAGRMRLLFYDKFAYAAAEVDEPSLRWTWDELAQDATAVSDPTSDKIYRFGFMDTSNDALFSYAYNWKNSCTEAATVRCKQPLTDTAVAAALTWMDEMVTETGTHPNFAQEPNFALNTLGTRDYILSNWQSARRQTVIWVEEPINYEFLYLLDPVGVVSFPGSDRFDGITPLHVQGHIISQSAKRPLVVWQWLRFLSNQPLRPSSRLVPARPSVAQASRFWDILPRELRDVMRTAFPFARPVTIEEQQYFTWSQIAAVLKDEVSPETAVYIKPRLVWFGE